MWPGGRREAPARSAAPVIQRVEVRWGAPTPRSVWRIGLVLLAVVATGAFGWFVLTDAGAALFTILMAWFTSITMEPAIRRLELRMRRGAAVLLVMGAVALFLIVFALAFGRLFLTQIAALLRGLPGIVENVLSWVNETFSTAYSSQDLQRALKLTPEDVAGYADDVVGGFAGVIVWVAQSFLRAFTAVFLVY